MDVVKKNLSDLFVAERNVRKHPETQITELQRSYEMFGQYRPLVVTAEGEILVGNGLFTAVSRLGVETIDCIVLPANTPEKYKQKLMLADNKTFELGANDVMNIDAIMLEIEDFEIPGFDEQTLKELYAEADKAFQSIDNMFIVPDEKKTSINRISEERAANPTPTEPVKVAERTTLESIPQSETPTNNEGRSYITCPHCGMKIWES